MYDALTKDIHPEVKSEWGDLKSHCTRIPILRISKTARNLNKVFLTRGTPASAETIFSGFTHPCLLIRDPSINSSIR